MMIANFKETDSTAELKYCSLKQRSSLIRALLMNIVPPERKSALLYFQNKMPIKLKFIPV